MNGNQIMPREDLTEQRTKDNYFNATFTSKRWESLYPGSKKTPSEYLRIKSTKELIDAMINDEGIDKPYTSSNKGTWMHPYLFVDFAMWVSTSFKIQVLKWVADGLMQSRHDAGDYHKQMCATIMTKYLDVYGTKPPTMLFINESKMIKRVSGLKCDRNEMTESDLSRITVLQKVNSNLITKNVGKASRIKQLEMINESLL